jgi:peptidoglycan/xylan/chitin deacetylase (PgdA/CDA1 family)
MDGVSRGDFAKMLAVIAESGYVTVSLHDYGRLMNGEAVDVPGKPILITFDDGRLDAYHGADDLLVQAHARATMYVITARAEKVTANFMTWPDVEAAHASGHWDIQAHAHAGHTFVPVPPDPGTGVARTGHAYAWRQLITPAGSTSTLETFEAWKQRVEDDIAHADELLAKHVPGYESLSFAVPFGDYGQLTVKNQLQSDDPTIAPELRRYLDERFPVWFTEKHNPAFSAPGPMHERFRYSTTNKTTPQQVKTWLENPPCP